MLDQHQDKDRKSEKQRSDRRGRNSGEFSARETQVTIVVVEPPKKAKGQTSIYTRFWRAVCLLLMISIGIGLWKIAEARENGEYDYVRRDEPTRRPRRKVPKPEHATKDVAAEVKKWDIEWTADGLSKNITLGTWEAQVDKILSDFKARYPNKYKKLPFDIKEHYRWKVKFDRQIGGSELEVYSMLYYDWSSHNEDSPLDKLKYGKEIYVPFTGSKTKTNVPQRIIDAFNASDAPTQAAKEIFDIWEGADGLCAEECAIRLGLLARDSGTYFAVMKEGHEVQRQCDIFERANHAVLFMLLKNKAFRNFLAWKGLRAKSKYNTWGTLIYNQINTNPYETLICINDKDFRWEFGEGDFSIQSRRKAGNNLPAMERLAESLPKTTEANADAYLRHTKWPRIEFLS